MFVAIFASIKKHKEFVHKQKGAKGALRSKFVGALSLAVMFGLGWGFGLLATSYPVQAITITFQSIFSIFVGIQGILIFIIHGVRNPDASRVWKQCVKTKLLPASIVKTLNPVTRSTRDLQPTLPEIADEINLNQSEVLQCKQTEDQVGLSEVDCHSGDNADNTW